MNFREIAVAALIAITGIAASASAPQKMGGYDFSYTSSGEPRVRPVQVFDDGQSTYFQFRAGEPVPAIFAHGSGRPVLVTPRIEGPFVRVDTLAKKFDLRLGRRSGKVEYVMEEKGTQAPSTQMNLPAVSSPARAGGAYAEVVTPNAVASTQSQSALPPHLVQLASLGIGINGLPRPVFADEPAPRIALDLNSYAIPVRGDVAHFQPAGVSPMVEAVADREKVMSASHVVPFVLGVSSLGPRGRATVGAAAKRYRGGAQIEVVGHYDSTYKEGLADARFNAIKQQLIKLGVPASSITGKTTDSQSSAELKGAVAGATIYVRFGTSGASAGHAFVDTRQQTAAELDALVKQLRAGRISPSSAAREIEQVRDVATRAHVQPHSGWQEAQITRWEMRKADGTVQALLQRWADEAGWQLIWKNGPEVQIHGDAVLVRDGFVSASDYVLAQARSFGHKVKGRAYNNKVLVISAD